MALGAYAVSDDGSLLAYSTDNTGFRQYTLLREGPARRAQLAEQVAEKVGSVAWAADNQTLFYTVEDESTKRQYRLYRHALGREPPRPRLRGEGRALQHRRRPHAQRRAT